MDKNTIDKFFLNLIPSKITKSYIHMPFGENLNIIKDFIYPSDVTKLRPGKGKEGDKMPKGVQYIVIHDTGMAQKQYNGYGLNEYIHTQANKIDGRVASWHFSCGADAIYEHIPIDEIGWHAGDGSRGFKDKYFNETYNANCIGGGNQSGIGIETCINQFDDYLYTLSKCAKLVATLLIKYDLDIDRIKMHNNFSGKDCPNIILHTKGLWEHFIEEVKLQMEIMNLGNKISLTWKFDNDLISKGGIVKRVLVDTPTMIKLKLTIDDDSYFYCYDSVITPNYDNLYEEGIASNIYYSLCDSKDNIKYEYEKLMSIYKSELVNNIIEESDNEFIVSYRYKETNNCFRMRISK